VPVIARSEATKQSIPSPRRDGLLRGACHRARIRATRWLAMTAPIFKHASASSRRDASEFCKNHSPRDNRGRRECRASNAPAASRAERKKHTSVVTTVTPETPGIPRAMVYGLLRALPGDQACLTPSPALLLADLTPASGRQNHTTWPYASARFVKRTARVHRIPPRVDDVAQRPSVEQDVGSYGSDLGQARSKIFFKWGLDRLLVICPSGRFVESVRQFPTM
jgi:hypothetical protein